MARSTNNPNQQPDEVMALVSIGYDRYALSLEDALTYARIFASAERYERNYTDGATSHHIYRSPASQVEVTVISAEFYNMARLAGEPVKKS